MDISKTLQASISAWKTEAESDSSLPRRIPVEREKNIQHVPMDCWGLFRKEDIVHSYVGTGGIATCLGLITWTSCHILVLHLSVEDKTLSTESFSNGMQDMLCDFYRVVEEDSNDILGGWALTADGEAGTGGKMLATVLSLNDKIKKAKCNNGTMYCTADSTLYVGPDYGTTPIVGKVKNFGHITPIKDGIMEWNIEL